MELTKFKITAEKLTGYMMVVYQDNQFKSVLNEFKPALKESQLNGLLNYITIDPNDLQAMFMGKYGAKIKVERVKAIGSEPEAELMPDFPVNLKIALWCELYSEFTKDTAGNALKYKTGSAEAGKLKLLAVTPEELRLILEVYFKSTEWYTIPKSITNFVKKYNEIRALAYAAPVEKKKKDFPLPFDEAYFNRLEFMDQRAYWDHLRLNGYKWTAAPSGRGGKWEKVHPL